MSVVTFGEIMLRLSPSKPERIIQASKFDIAFGGSEANVAVSLAQFKTEASFVTRIPHGQIGEAALMRLRAAGVGTDFIVLGGDRIGIYFLEHGTAQRPSQVIYDRGYSSLAEATPLMFDWKKILSGKKWFHISGITPALSRSLPEICISAVRQARALNLHVSCDLNFRRNLWRRREAEPVMREMLKYVDILFANEEDAESIFGIQAPDSDIEKGKIDPEGYREVAAELIHQFPKLSTVAITLRESVSASLNRWSGLMYIGKILHKSRSYEINVTDRVGSGDAFCAGMIYGLHNNMAPSDCLEFAVAASALKHSIVGDWNLVSLEDVQTLLRTGGSGRVQR